ncbi:MAG: serine hydrolase domain-containing protein [Planctomycetota bacterium]
MSFSRARNSFVFSVCFALSSRAEPPAPRSLNDLLEPIRAKNKFPALAACVVTTDGVQAIGATGTRRAGKEEPVTADDLWHLGSCTKSMTATLVARLEEQGKLKWTTSLAEAFPKLKPPMDPGWAPVTLEQLLSNRGGAPANLDRDGLWGNCWSHKGTPREARHLLLEGVLKHPPEYEPGTKFLYSNANFAIAGHVAESAADLGWEELIQHQVFKPLGILNAGFGAPGKKGDKADQPCGHDAKGIPVGPGPGADNPVAIGPAGIVHMSLADWSRFLAAHLSGARGSLVKGADGKPFLKPDSWKKLHTPPADGYAMGWSVSTRPWAKGDKDGDTGRVLTHNGSNTMWFCVTWLAPEKGFAVLVTCNTGGDSAGKGTDEAAWAVIQDWQKK